MRSTNILGAALAALCVTLASCGGGGGGSSSSSSSGGSVPAVFTLNVVTQPGGATASSPLATQPVVRVLNGNVTATSDNSTVVTASIASGTGPAGATLNGTATATVVAGVATFANLGIGTAGTGYQLQFSAPGMVGATSSSFEVAAPAPAVQVNFAIDSSLDVRPISRFIYGMNGWDPSTRPANLTLSRSGGNRMTAYNWETNASNAGSDFQNQNDSFLGGGSTPNGAVAPAIESARAAGAGIVVTLPTIGYVAADKNGGGDVNLTANYLAARFRQSLPRKGGAFSLAPDTTDGFVYQDEYVHFLDQTYAGAFAAAGNPIFLSMDNEPDLWHTTHARLRGDAVNPPATQHGTNVTYAEIVQRTRDYANAAKDVNPAVTIFGPVNYGWQGYIRLQDAADANNRDFLDFFLQQMAAAQVSDGRRVLDVLDVHWYPEAQGGGVRVTEDNATAAVAAARKQAPRSLWDPAYTETSWITQFSTNGPIRLIPRLRDKIAAHYPGTRLAITEYNYGGANDISGAIAQADVLGIFGREGLFAANLWRLSNNNNFLYGAFEMFRNYDGANGSFGDTSIRATSSDVAGASVYASVNTGNAGRMVVVAINKNDTPLTAGFAVAHGTRFHTAQLYRLTSASSQPQRQPDIGITQANAFQYTMPANSITTLVLLP
ncbi:MAG TPA: glycoside hydrolase family 44 protein [Steroidobacteraceae bacterium]|nr:glycoside hydrolase family 44 protein [Steroidobacteraceae bacterium]